MDKRKLAAKILNLAAGFFCLVAMIETAFLGVHIEWLILVFILFGLSIVVYPERFEAEKLEENKQRDFYETVILNRRGKS